MIEHGGAVEQRFENDDGGRGRAERDHDAHLDRHRKQNLQRMEAKRRRYVEPRIGVMYRCSRQRIGTL